MELLRAHLNRSGIAYYNSTWSEEVLATGATAFPYALRVANFLAVSDSPFTLDNNRWRAELSSYAIDGKPVFNLADPDQRAHLDSILQTVAQVDDPKGQLESRDSLLRRLEHARLITDDNMGTEWQ
jgi:hypothetical protein